MTLGPEMPETRPVSDSSSQTPPETGEPTWSLAAAFLFMLLWIALMFVIQMSSIFIAAAISRPELMGAEEFGPFFEQFINHIAGNPWAAFGVAASVLLTWMITFKLLELFFRGAPRPALGRALGLSGPKPRWAMVAAVPVGILAFLVGATISQALQVDDSLGPYDKLVETIPGFVGTAILALLIAPPAEEAFFRGFLFPPMRRYLSAPTAILVNGAVFALAHLLASADISILLPVLLIGALAAALRNWSGSIWPGAMAHLVFNGMSLFIFLLNKGPSGA